MASPQETVQGGKGVGGGGGGCLASAPSFPPKFRSFFSGRSSISVAIPLHSMRLSLWLSGVPCETVDGAQFMIISNVHV
jgi:hypothetical protein